MPPQGGYAAKNTIIEVVTPDREAWRSSHGTASRRIDHAAELAQPEPLTAKNQSTERKPSAKPSPAHIPRILSLSRIEEIRKIQREHDIKLADAALMFNWGQVSMPPPKSIWKS